MLWGLIASTAIGSGSLTAIGSGQYALHASTPRRVAIHLQVSGLRKPAAQVGGRNQISGVTRLVAPDFSEEASESSKPFPASSKPFSASRWHRERRRQILVAHPDVRNLIGDDSWVFALGLVILPLYAWVLWHSPAMSWEERTFHVWTTCSLRASWAVYCSHAISHGRWRGVGPPGSVRYNLALATANIGTVMGILPSYWLTHHGHHSNLGKYSIAEARQRAKEGRQTDGDLGIAARAFSPPSRKYRLVADPGGK